jgi:MFS family permease
MAYPLSMLIFEIPTGAIADLYGRKFSVVLGHVLEGIAFLMMFFVTGYYAIFFLFAFFGFASTLSSGSKEAWIADLVKKKDKKLLHEYFVKSSFLTSSALFLSGFVGAFFVKAYGIPIIWLFAFVSFMFTSVILLLGKEEFFKEKIHIKESFKKIIKQSKISINYTRKHPVLFYLIAGGFFMILAGVFTQGISWIPFLQSLNFPDYAFGYMWSAMFAVIAIAPFFAKKLKGKSKEKSFIIKASLIGSLTFLLVYFTNSWAFALAIMLIAEFFLAIQTPVGRTYFHKFVPTKLRATIGSVESMIFAIAAIIALPLVGYLIDVIGPRYVIMLSAVVAIPGIILYLLIKEGGK